MGTGARDLLALDRSAVKYPREVAVRILGRVLGDGLPLDEVLRDATSVEAAQLKDPRAMAWLQEACSGTLRWRGRLDRVIDSCALKKKPTGWLRRALQLGAYQLIVQERVMPAAVVNETVGAIKGHEGEAPARFANAVLRKIAEQASAWRAQDLREDRPPVEQAAWASLPEWWWRRVVKDRGLGWAKEYALACLERPTLWLRSRGEFELGEAGNAGPVSRSYRVSQGGAVTSLPGFSSGSWIVQDISSQKLVTEAVEAARRLGLNSGARALDLCAAPGGKAIALAWEGLDVTASDRDVRLPLLRESIERVHSTDRIRAVRQEELRVENKGYDLVWVDAPCTGSGIIRRHPDVRWLRQEKDLASLARSQRELLQDGWSRVAAGGFLLYSVCSIFTEEGAGLLKSSAPVGSSVVQTWDLAPQSEPYGDGFWGVLLRRTR